jgi:hypothetical protein
VLNSCCSRAVSFNAINRENDSYRELETCWPDVEVVKTLETKYRTKGIDFVHIET